MRCPLCILLLPEKAELQNDIEKDDEGHPILFKWIPCCSLCKAVAMAMAETRKLEISAAKIIRSRIIFQ